MKNFIIILLLVAISSCSNGNRQTRDNAKPQTDSIQPANGESDIANPSFQPAIEQSDTTFSITYRNSKFEYYGTPDACYDNLAIAIGKSEYTEAADKFKNLELDTNIRIPFKDGVFSIPLEDGSIKELANSEEADDAMVEYHYTGYFPAIRSYEFSAFMIGGDGIVFVSKKDGKEQLFKNRPIFAPHTKLCATIRLEQEGVDSAGTIEVYLMTEDGYEFLFGLWSEKILPDSGCWLYNDNNTLYIKATHAEGDTERFQYYKIALDQLTVG